MFLNEGYSTNRFMVASMTDTIKRTLPKSPIMEIKNIYLILAAILVVAINLFYILTLRPAELGGPDMALYVMHAKNIAEGFPYATTNYLYNPLNPSPHPAAYPPGLPLLLAPIYAAF